MMIGCSRNTQPKPFSMQNSDTDFTLSLLSDSLDRDNIFTNRDVSAGYDDKVYRITLADNKSSSDNKRLK